MDQSLIKNFNFSLIEEFGGYDSTLDPTKCVANLMVYGSQNIYKKINGNLAVRPGMKLRGALNATSSPISSEYVWNANGINTYPLIVSEGYLQVEYNSIYYNLMTTAQTRFVFDTWDDVTNSTGVPEAGNSESSRDRLLFVNGDNNIYSWTGGVAVISDASNKTGVIVPNANYGLSGIGGLNGITYNLTPPPTYTYYGIPPVVYLGGSGYVAGDIISIGGAGTGATAEVTTTVDGVALTIQVNDGGAGYAVGDILDIAPVITTGIGAICKVATIGGGGGTGPVTTVTLLYGGYKAYFGGVTGLDTSAVSGTGCKIEILTIGNGSIVTILLLTLGTGYTVSTGNVTTAVTGVGTGALLDIASIYTGPVLTISGFPNWQKAGFEGGVVAEKKLLINGTEYTYDGGETTPTLLNVSPTLTGVSVGDVVLQSVITYKNTPIKTLLPIANVANYFNFTNDFIKVIANQLYVGSYVSNFLFISSASNFTNFTPINPGVVGDPIFLQFHGKLNGITIRNGDATVSYGNSNWQSITFQDTTLKSGVVNQPVFTVYPTAENCGAYAHEFISTDGNNVVYLSKDKQVRSVGDFNQSFEQAYPSLSLEINSELALEDFTGGALKCIGEFTYLTVPTSGKTFLYQNRRSLQENGIVKVERLWHAPMLWNIGRVDDIDGEIYGFSNTNPQVYQLWNTNQWHDDGVSGDPLPYSCILKFAYRNLGQQKGGSRTRLIKFDKNYTEGYIAGDTNLNLIMNYEYEGSKNVLTAPINSVTRPAYTFGGSTPTISTTGSLGDDTLGDSGLGEGGIKQPTITDLSKFRCVNCFSLLNNNVFEYQTVYQSDDIDSQWEILATGTNMVPVEVEPTFIINKA